MERKISNGDTRVRDLFNVQEKKMMLVLVIVLII